MLKLQSEDIAAEVQRMFDAESEALELNEPGHRPSGLTRLNHRFPVSPPPAAEYDAVNDTSQLVGSFMWRKSELFPLFYPFFIRNWN